MVLLDRRILAGGLALIAAGIATVAISADVPAGREGMTEEEVIDLMIAEDSNQAYQMLSGILMGVGFLLVLISFGARKGRKKRDSIARKKPAE